MWVPLGVALSAWSASRLRGATPRSSLRSHATLVVGTPIAAVLKLLIAWKLAFVIVAAYLAGLLIVDCIVTRVDRRRTARRIGFVAFMWAAFTFGAAWLTSPHRPNSERLIPPGGVLVCLGDSLTSGLRPDRSGTYPEFLAAETGLRVLNAGVANDTVADALARVERDVLAHGSDAVLVMIGGNDYLYGTPRDVFERRLDELVGEIAARCSCVILVEVPSGIAADRFAGAYTRVAHRHDALLIPDSVLRARFLSGLVLDRLRPKESRETEEGIHLTEVGQRRLAAALVSYLRHRKVVR